MDSLTQAALGAAIGHVMLSKGSGYRGAVAGACIATIPDLDVVLYLFYSKFEMLSIHRGYSHSIIVNSVLSLFIAWMLARIKSFQPYSFKRLFSFSFLALITHLILDACTTYGTQLFLPLSDQRVSFDMINVVDPLYTIPLVLGLAWAIISGRRGRQTIKPVVAGLIISTIYLASTYFIKTRVQQNLEQKVKSEQITMEGMLISPVSFGSNNWYQVVRNEDSLYIRPYQLFGGVDEVFTPFAVNEVLFEGYDPHMTERLRWFAKDNYTLEKRGDTLRMFNLQVDMRGIVDVDSVRAPTHGFFSLYRNQKGETIMDSGQIEIEQKH